MRVEPIERRRRSAKLRLLESSEEETPGAEQALRDALLDATPLDSDASAEAHATITATAIMHVRHQRRLQAEGRLSGDESRAFPAAVKIALMALKQMHLDAKATRDLFPVKPKVGG